MFSSVYPFTVFLHKLIALEPFAMILPFTNVRAYEDQLCLEQRYTSRRI